VQIGSRDERAVYFRHLCTTRQSLGPVGASPYSVVLSPLVNLSGTLEAPVVDE